MTECMHDPAFIFDGICSICHRQRRKLIAFMREHDAELTTEQAAELEADLELTRRIWQTTTPEPY